MPINTDALRKLGQTLNSLFTEYSDNKESVEEQMLKNYRQYRGIYDPEIKIPAGYSRAYPKITRVKVRSLLAKLMEMLFPATERNWDIKPTPRPNISQDQLQEILNGLRQAAEEGGLTEDTIDKAVDQWAKDRSTSMLKDMDDQLQQIEFKTLAKRVIKSGIMYGVGVLRGPMVTKTIETKWSLIDGNITVEEVEVLQPYFEFVSVWDFFPDFAIKEFVLNEKFFERHLMPRHDVMELSKRDDFFKDEIIEYLRVNKDGDYKETSNDLAMRQVTDKDETPGGLTKLYSVKQCVGYLTGHELRAAGVEIADDDLEVDALADIWLLGDYVIKAAPLPYDSPLDFYHLFILDEEEETEPMGPALPENIRDSQMAVSASTRMLMDNASITTGAIFEINRDLLSPGQEGGNIHAFKVFWRQGLGAESQYPAIRTYKFDSHINELLAIISQFRDFSDEESMLPKFAIGGESRPSEGLRTAAGTSMLFGASNTTLKDIVRQYDKFQTSVLRALYKWNMLFGDNEKSKGDFQIIARGSTSLIAKELRAQALDNLNVTMTPEERRHVDERSWLEERMKVRDVDIEGLLLDKDVVAQNDEREFELRKAQADADTGLVTARTKKLLTSAATEMVDAQRKGGVSKAQIAEILSRVEANMAKIDDSSANTDLNFIRQLGESISQLPGAETVIGEQTTEQRLLP